MALLVLISTFSFTVEKHFCGNFLVDVSYFGNTKSCADVLSNDSCGTADTVKNKKCCKNEFQNIDGQDDLNNNSVEKTAFEIQFALAFTISYHNLFINLKKQIVPHRYYSPPNLVSDIQLLQEVFII